MLWKKLVKLYHPDRFAHEPDKLATYEKLTAAINRAKEAGDIETLREIAEDPAWLHPAAGLGETGFQRRGGTGTVAAAA